MHYQPYKKAPAAATRPSPCCEQAASQWNPRTSSDALLPGPAPRNQAGGSLCPLWLPCKDLSRDNRVNLWFLLQRDVSCG